MGARSELTAWSGDLTRPVPLGAAAVLALNDHVLKGAGVLPGAVTGKLSDVAGLLVGGIAAVCVARGAAGAITGRLPRRDGRLAAAVLSAVGVVFAALKLWPAGNAAVARVWGTNVLDPSDLWTLPMLAVAFLWLRDREHGAEGAVPRRFASALALGAVLLVCAATPAPPPVPPQPVPAWMIEAGALPVPCGEVEAWVSKSGRTGLGLTVAVTPAGEALPCDVAIASATLRFADGVIAGHEVPVNLPPSPSSPHERPRVEPGTTWRFVGFEFDNLARWNRGERAATFELELIVGGERRVWSLPARHAYVTVSARARRYW